MYYHHRNVYVTKMSIGKPTVAPSRLESHIVSTAVVLFPVIIQTPANLILCNERHENYL